MTTNDYAPMSTLNEEFSPLTADAMADANPPAGRQDRQFHLRKRHRTVCHDEDDDEPPYPSFEPELEAKQPPETREHVELEPASQDAAITTGRLVSLTIRTSKTSKASNASGIKFFVQEGVVRQIPEYASKLDAAVRPTPTSKRLRIYDGKFRKEEVMTQTFEYLSSETLESLDSTDPAGCLKTLFEFIELYDLSIDMSITKLEQAIVDQIASLNSLHPETFVMFASECYRTTHKVYPDSSIGQLIKAHLAQHLEVLISSGVIEQIKDGGGTLNKQLVEVLMERFQASLSKAGDEKVKIEIED